jgi:PilZ domain
VRVTGDRHEPGEMPRAQESRKAARFPLASTIRVRKCDASAGEWTSAHGLNLSESGVAFLADQPLAPGTLLQVELPNSRCSAIGPVRNCQRRGNLWRIGVELAGPFLSMS